MAEEGRPPLATIHYLLEGVKPEDLWGKCVKRLIDWEKDSSHEFAREAMSRYTKQRALNMVWGEQKLRDSLPPGIDEKETFKVLGKIYDASFDDTLLMPGSGLVTGTNADTERQSIQQLSQHMKAYKLLCGPSDESLTTELIEKVHGVLMHDLKNPSGEIVCAGEYRKGIVHAGDHVFPDPKYVPSRMEKLVNDYNKQSSVKHDMYALASWLLYQFVTLHPFEDGNGRMCRLLWCYSLMKDGLPFPVTISSGHKKAHKHYVSQIEADRSDPRVSGQPHLTTLTVFAINKAWNNFYGNLKYELEEDQILSLSQ